jgi:hypothetical protein
LEPVTGPEKSLTQSFQITYKIDRARHYHHPCYPYIERGIMPSPKQTAANRMNSQKSTGPDTTAGQAASRYNAVKHGIFATTQIMFDEKAEDLADLAAEYHEHHCPADPGQRFLVDTLVNNEWRLRRLRRVDAELWDTATNTFMAANIEVPACTSGDAFATAAPTFERLQRVVNACERTYHRALRELQRAKVGQAFPPANPGPPPPIAKPEGPAKAPQPEQSKPSSEKLASFRQNPATPPSAAPKPPDAPPAAPPFAGQPTPTQPSDTADSSDEAPKTPENV